jgi:ferrous iron transport protein A
MTTTNLCLLQRHQRATIAHLQAEPGLHQRLLALGFRTGRQVVMLRKAWFFGPVHVRVGMTEVMLRRREAMEIHVTTH